MNSQESICRGFGRAAAILRRRNQESRIDSLQKCWCHYLIDQDVADYGKCRAWYWDEFCWWIDSYKVA